MQSYKTSTTIANIQASTTKIEIGDDGKSEIEFYTTDAQSTTYDIVIEGITDTGTPFSSRSTLAIE
ncbi:MAG: hypothetical protein K2G49_12265 [Muribaculum sp.]|nr:hypothetical protein [Muribaculum sp.]